MNTENIACIDVNFDFTSDTPKFWNNFWEDDELCGNSKADPDGKSPTLRLYHKLLWSRELPNGETMQLEDGRSKYYLRWNDIYFGSDSILSSFRYERNRPLFVELKKSIPEYRPFIENFLHEAYTIGGMMLFPSFSWCINQARGCNLRICDRWDLTLECIRLFYEGKESPIYKSLAKSKSFFDLFVDFKGFVDFFFLQDCVTEDYSSIKFWYDSELFVTNPIPHDTESYINYINAELEFLSKRNKRIEEFIRNYQ